MRSSVGHYILCTYPSVGLRRGCGLSLSFRFRIQLALVAGFRRVSSLAFSLVLSCVFYICLIEDMTVILEICLSSLLENYHHISVVPR